MIINYVPGEECRVAIVEDGKLEELYAERFAQASRVGNIFVGKVVNVEPAIQAAFVDFGVGDNGFLHVTDLHPRYFPGEEETATESVGFKTPRRERPPIQAALRRGDEVIVQVLKEGVGTKGPTVTSYLSIPGRFLVMMPYMDRVGVSRKVEDEDQRRKMREILDQLDLPEGFGFILRTAGFEATKTELKRDLAYLQRLWKDMDRRLKVGGKPRLLYSESDLLVRSLRDMMTADTTEVVIDHEIALRRAAKFMKIVSPRGAAKLMHYPAKTPIFHAFGVERQIAFIHAREVPLPSGGRLVIDQTEALVAIDVNSGKSRESRNSEDNAYQTNIEAVDEICRQLRLRDMGGIVINDLIDMRHASHRKDIENRFKERLKRDRAKSSITGISEFGILEMTRQRMRPSHESVHFTDCPICRGRGVLQKPDSLASDALRDLAAVLDVDRVHRVEMVVAPRIAGELLSSKRALLSRIERSHGKHVDVRVSETVSVDRVTFYAYDEQGQDIDTQNLPQPKKPRDLVPFVDPTEVGSEWAIDEAEETAAATPEPEPEVEPDVHPIELDELPPEPDGEGAGGGEPGEGGGRRRRRRRRRGRGRGGEGSGERAPGEQTPQASPAADSDTEAPRGDDAGENQSGGGSTQAGEGAPGEGGGRRRRRRRRRGRGGGGAGGEGDGGQGQDRAPMTQRAAPQPRPATPETGGDWGDDGGGPKDAPQAAEAASMSQPHADEPESEGEGSDDAEGAAPGSDGGEGQAGGGEQSQGEGGERRRRRRRRRGRGGSGGEGRGDGGSGRGQTPRQDSRPEPRERPPAARKPEPASEPQRPRSLYGSSRRKLNPSELNKRPKPE
ncbi:MAG: Rne/Rng family ribonuclease [Phycisphaerales bacterium]|nr:Rne/Rng family ribonuclease [Phycisphaerales bacterium]